MFLFIQRFYALLVFYNILYCLIFQHLSTFLPAASPLQLFQLSRLFPFDFIGFSSLLPLYRLVNYSIKLSPFSISTFLPAASPLQLFQLSRLFPFDFIGFSSLLPLYRLVNYSIKLSPFSTSPVPKTSSPKTLSFINLIIQIKSSCSSITFFKSFLNIINFEGVISPRKTDF